MLVQAAIDLVILLVPCMGLQLDIKAALPVQGGGREYIYHTEKIPWNEAVTYCEDIGGKLAKIDSAEFQHHLINAFEAAYGSNPFSDDYWTGIFQPSQGDFRWASDCSEAYYTSNLNTDWDNSKRCFKHKKDEFTGDREACSSDNAFICEKPLPAGYSCALSDIFTANSLGTEVLDLAACEAACNTDADCWMVMFTPPYGCVKLAYNTATLASGVEAANSPVKMKGRFCIEVSIDTSGATPSSSDSSNTPAVDCSGYTGPIASVSSIAPPPIPATSAILCATETITAVSMQSCSTQTMTENIYHTAICSAETLTVIPTMTCTPELSTVLVTTSSDCISSSCTCSAAVSTVLSSSCPSIASSSSIITVSSSVNVEHLAAEIVKNLTVDEKSTSAYRRKLISARDERALSKTMGYLGICFVSIPLGLIILLDIRKMALDFTQTYKYKTDDDDLSELHNYDSEDS